MPAAVPPWTMAVAAMLAVQVSNALSVPVVAQVGPAGTAWLRMSFGIVFLWLIARPALRSLRLRHMPALLVLSIVTSFMTTFFLAAVARIPLGTAVAIEFLGPLTVAGLMSPRRRALIWPLIAFAGVILLAEPWHGTIDLAAAFGTLLSIEPAFGVLMGLLILAQTPTVMQLIGIACVIVAGAAAQRGGSRTADGPALADRPGSPPREVLDDR